MIWKERNTLLC